MNNKTTYESIIAEKVAQLPVPDMADAIWANISLGLDAAADMDAPDQPLPANTMTLTAKIWMGIIAAVAVAVLLLLYVKNRKQKTAPAKNIPSAIQQQAKNPRDSTVTYQPPPTGRETMNATANPGASQAILPVNTTPDSLSIVPLNNSPLSTIRQDSNQATIPPSLIDKRENQATIPPPIKKPRGVGGITDNDYKIKGGKKDSL
ncbi:MAG: hypothetical protein EOO06_04765 [Chitinophagaceae bacterium]|nr:MAG: hypothetical protein EOO06_04765 [Chitinophagaceae bacterium]